MHGWWVVGLALAWWALLAYALPQEQHPFQRIFPDVTAFKQYPLSECPSPSARPVLRVAIIGAGVSGASVAHFLSTAQKSLDQLRLKGIPGCEHATLPEHMYVTVYERTPRVGGRVYSIHPLNDSNIMPVEIGASIYSSMNQNIAQAVKAMHFKSVSRELLPGSRLGLWDGTEFVFDNFKGSKWDYWKLYWRYGSSPRILLDLYVFPDLRQGGSYRIPLSTNVFSQVFARSEGITENQIRLSMAVSR